MHLITEVTSKLTKCGILCFYFVLLSCRVTCFSCVCFLSCRVTFSTMLRCAVVWFVFVVCVSVALSCYMLNCAALCFLFVCFCFCVLFVLSCYMLHCVLLCCRVFTVWSFSHHTQTAWEFVNEKGNFAVLFYTVIFSVGQVTCHILYFFLWIFLLFRFFVTVVSISSLCVVYAGSLHTFQMHTWRHSQAKTNRITTQYKNKWVNSRITGWKPVVLPQADMYSRNKRRQNQKPVVLQVRKLHSWSTSVYFCLFLMKCRRRANQKPLILPHGSKDTSTTQSHMRRRDHAKNQQSKNKSQKSRNPSCYINCSAQQDS